MSNGQPYGEEEEQELAAEMGAQCTCDLCDVSRDPWHPEYVRGQSRGCLIHGTDEERQARAEREEWARTLEQRRAAAARAAREAP